MANLKVKFKCSSCGNEFNQIEQASLFRIITSLKYKLVLCILEEDGNNQLVSVQDIINFFIT